ncbi:hypothetical protein [Aureispira anguillae]|uniref:Uncharacterized protein n=1 Tax=Aureispira anguillae TaxID=2864201 RepID=A0A915YM71_9BACT|nr:hypothetical protein [Aureispira anguillae]BDS15683.1 hypothetical protein AsAng_0064670 [Aureispira anguillae]
MISFKYHFVKKAWAISPVWVSMTKSSLKILYAYGMDLEEFFSEGFRKTPDQ